MLIGVVKDVCSEKTLYHLQMLAVQTTMTCRRLQKKLVGLFYFIFFCPVEHSSALTSRNYPFCPLRVFTGFV
jgi:hypothetical protein